LQLKLATNVWMGPPEDIGKAKQITFGTGGYFGKVSWTPDDRIVFDSEAGNASAISIMNVDGSNQKRLSGEPNAEAIVGYATATPDGRYIVYYSNRAGARNIWRMNSDGSNPVQLTKGEGEDDPDCSPDSKWVVFTKQERGGSGSPTLWKVPIDGGQPVQLSREYTTSPSVSPDGKLIACSYSPSLESAGQPSIFAFDGSGLVKTFPRKLVGSSHIRWTHDGRGLIYNENPVGPSKLWLQPIDGGPPRALLELETDRIFGFDISRDGKRIALVRGFWSQNVVIVRGM
jgi:Tol biopolymer transport system component